MSGKEPERNVDGGEALRFSQRRLILMDFDEDQKNRLQNLFPDDRTLVYNFAIRPGSKQNGQLGEVYLDDLMLLFSPYEFDESQGGYPLIFRLACTARTPAELYNLFQGIKALEQIEGSTFSSQYSRLISPSRERLYRHEGRVSASQLSKEARWVYAQMENLLKHGYRTTDNFVQDLGKKFYNPESDSYKRYHNALAETFLYLVLSRELGDSWWNNSFLHGAGYFQFGEKKDDEGKLEMFNSKASFWQAVDGSWAGIGLPSESPDVFSSQERDDLYERLANKEFELREALNEIGRLKMVLRSIRVSSGNAVPQSVPETGGATDRILGLCGLTRDDLETMTPEEKMVLINRLRRLAGIVYHPDNGISPNEEELKAINAFLNDQDPRLHQR